VRGDAGSPEGAGARGWLSQVEREYPHVDE
jgi:hypothetical protein